MFLVSSRLAAVFAQTTEAMCSVENEDVVGAVPTGDAPTPSEWSTILLPTKVRYIIEAWGYTVFSCALFACVIFWVGWCDIFTHNIQGCFTGTRVRMKVPDCQWSNPRRCRLYKLVSNDNTQWITNREHFPWDALCVRVQGGLSKTRMSS